MITQEEYALLSARVYDASARNKTFVPAGWTEIAWEPDYLISGFSAGVYRKEATGEIVIAYTGTNDYNLDWIFGDIPAALGVYSSQVSNAMLFYEWVKTLPDVDPAKITFTGHSLGGGLASVMSVFFNKPATVFAEAPFQLTATNLITLGQYNTLLLAAGYVDTDYSAYISDFITTAGQEFSTREANVTQCYIENEELHVNPLLALFPEISGGSYPIELGGSTADSVTRHSILLHDAAILSDDFLSAACAMPDFISLLTDNNLYAAKKTDATKTDILSMILRHQVGMGTIVLADGMLDGFGRDAQTLSGGGLIKDASGLEDALIKALLQGYYRLEHQQFTEDLFTDVTGGFYLDVDRIADNAPSIVSYVDIQMALSDYFGSGSFLPILISYDRWYFQSGGAPFDVVADEGHSDLIAGWVGFDQLVGGDGNDLLLGGKGFDTYIYNFGDGTDSIIDTDGLGRIIYRDAQGTEYTLDGGMRSPLSNGVYYGDNGRFTYSLDEVNHALIVTLDGQTAMTIQNYDKVAESLGIALGINQAPEIHISNSTLEPIRLVSVAANGAQANDYSYSPSISADGRYVAFVSYASNLVSGDTNVNVEGEKIADVFVKDLQTGAIVRASTAADGSQAKSETSTPSYDTSISADGRYVTFDSGAFNLVPGDTNGFADFFVKDLLTGAIVRINTAADGTEANNGIDTDGISISADGHYVAFVSNASNLVAGDTNGIEDVFVKNLQTGAIVRANTAADGTEANAYQYNDCNTSSISADGRYVAFWSDATNLVPGDTNGVLDIFVKDLQTGAIVRANTAADGSQANGGSSPWHSISADGRYIAFQSFASNLVPGDTNGVPDIFVKDLQTGAIVRVNIAIDGTQATKGSYSPAISADGRCITFESWGSNLVAGDTNGVGDIFTAPNSLSPPQIVTVMNTSVILDGISVTDSDAGASPLAMLLSVGHGGLALRDITGLTFTDADGSDGTLAFSGLLSDINTALSAGILYVPATAYIGDDELDIAINDQVYGASLTDTAALAITVLPPPVITGTAGNDTLTGTNGNDTFNGGAGNDTFTGNAGNDTYIFNLGDGVDTIIDSTAGGEINTVSFGTGIDHNSITLGLGSLLIHYGDQGDAIHIENFDPNDAYNPLSISEFGFADGTVWSYAGLINRGFDLTGTDTDDTISGTNTTDRITGSLGNDALDGGTGDDTYYYNVGDGFDSLTDSDGTDTVIFGVGYSFDNTVIRTEGGVAHLRFLDSDGNETSEGIGIALNSDGASPIETFAFEDGSTYSLDDLLITTQTLYGTKKADTLIGNRSDDTIYAGKGGDDLYGRTGNDTLYGEKGNDKLYGEGGNDNLYGGKGKDYLDGGAGNDYLDGGAGKNTLIGGQGNDTLILGNDSQNTVLFNSGDDWDTLKTNAKDAGHDNEVCFGGGITHEDLWFSRNGNNLQINILGTDDGMTIEGWYNNKHRPIEEFQTSNGYELDDKKVALLVQAMASFTPTPGSGTPLPTEMPDQLQATLAAAWESN